MKTPFKRHSVLPGFGLTMGFTLFYLSVVVLLPLTTLFLRSSTLGWRRFWAVVTTPNVVLRTSSPSAPRWWRPW